jgi:putative transposase
MKYWTERSELPCKVLLKWAKLSTGKYHTWRKRYGKINAHNGKIPRDWWLEEWEKQAILDFHDKHPLEGYRRLTFMMLDDDIVAVSPSTTYRVLKTAGRLDRKIVTPSKKGKGYIQPTKTHQEWHVDVSYINVGGTFYFLISVLDGFSRYIVHQELRETMKEMDIELVIAKGTEKHPGVKPRIISDNGPQFIAKDFKEFVREYGLTHVRTSPYYPQSNGKIERWHGSLKSECIRPGCPATKEEAEKRIASYVQYYNTVRLHSAIGYITPADCLAGLSEVIGQERDRKLESARKLRQEKRVESKEVA